MEADLREVNEAMKKYRGQWLALEEGTYSVLGHSKSREDVLREAREKKWNVHQLLHVSDKKVRFVGGLLARKHL